VRLRFDDSVEAFRTELLAWLAANRPSPEEMAADPSVSTGHVPAWARRWTRAMFDAGWLVPGWPPELGGRNAGPIETLVYLEELAAAGLPRTTNVQGLGIVAPSIVDYGTEAQRREFALPILRGEMTACLGMSEPGAGSDLASLATRAVLDGDHWVVNGQKVWTSGANYADFCFLFCRTEPDAPKHHGISILLVPMDTPGITVRPLPEIVHPEHPDLNEVFLTDVVVPRDNLVGERGAGWAMANGSLAHERGMVWVSAVTGLEEALARLVAEAPGLLARLPPTERALAVDQIVGLAIDTQAARCLGYRGFARLARGGTAPEPARM
jgi:alkylation response protein AidB-like acyl-CoA dehydrogenase